jgi:hypothetical protein
VGAIGAIDGAGTTATFTSPSGMTTDGISLYVTAVVSGLFEAETTPSQ